MGHRAYTPQYRLSVVLLALTGKSTTSQMAEELNIPAHSINKWKQQYTETMNGKAHRPNWTDKIRIERAEEKETLRDRFAMHAMTGMLSTGGAITSVACDLAYAVADTMMLARIKGGE